MSDNKDTDTTDDNEHVVSNNSASNRENVLTRTGKNSETSVTSKTPDEKESVTGAARTEHNSNKLETLENIFEPRPSAPAESLPQSRTAMKYRHRQSLPILPRMTQYEKHPLLQEKTESGLSEIEIFLIEKEKSAKEMPSRPRSSNTLSASNELTDKSRSPNRRRDSSPVKLIPRLAHCETNPLFERSLSGISELELLLKEKEQEIISRESSSTDSLQRTHRVLSVDSSDNRVPNCQLKLEPRVEQYEKHSLLQMKDESGLTLLEMLLQEREQELSDSANRLGAADRNRVTSSSTHSMTCTGVTDDVTDTTSRIEPRLNNKHVRFMKQQSERCLPVDSLQQSLANEKGASKNKTTSLQRRESEGGMETGNKYKEFFRFKGLRKKSSEETDSSKNVPSGVPDNKGKENPQVQQNIISPADQEKLKRTSTVD